MGKPGKTQLLVNEMKSTVSNAATSIDTTKITDTATKAQESVKNSLESLAGSVAGEVEGGVKQLTQNFDKMQDKLNNLTAEGLIDDGIQSLENMATDMVGEAVSGFLSKFGAGVSIAFSEPDSNGFVVPIEASLDVDGGLDTVASVLQLITGLGIDTGNLQKAIVEASPEGILNAGKDLLSGKMGAFDGAAAIKSLADTAITSVTNELESQVNSALAKVSNINSVFQAITGVDSDGLGNLITIKTGFSNIDRLADSAQFLAAIENIKGATTSDLNTVLTDAKNIKQNVEAGLSDFENISGGKDGQTVVNSINSKAKDVSRYSRAEEEYKTIVSQRIAKGSQRGVIQALSTETLTTVKRDIKKFAPKATDSQVNSIIKLSQGDAKEFSDAVRLLSRITDKSADAIRNFLKSIDTTITNALLPVLDDRVFSEPYVIGSFEKEWTNGTGDPVFPYISSVEELGAEFRNITREVTEVVVHWSETHTNRNIGSEEINRYHLSLGLNGIGYHYVIRRDGSIQRGRPVNIKGQHAPINGHDDRSIGLVFVGGINVPTGTPNEENFLSAASLTRSQINTFNHFCREFYKVFEGAQIVGHTDIDLVEIDPGFSVIDYVETNFNKKSLYEIVGSDPKRRGPFTQEELITGKVNATASSSTASASPFAAPDFISDLFDRANESNSSSGGTTTISVSGDF